MHPLENEVASTIEYRANTHDHFRKLAEDLEDRDGPADGRGHWQERIVPAQIRPVSKPMLVHIRP